MPLIKEVSVASLLVDRAILKLYWLRAHLKAS